MQNSNTNDKVLKEYFHVIRNVEMENIKKGRKYDDKEMVKKISDYLYKKAKEDQK